MADDSLISDELLRTLVGVGQVDLLVGVPTLNHAATIVDVVRAVDASFRRFFPRQRTVLINSDGGSTDDTVALVQSCCRDQSRTVTTSQGLRTTHRISTPYHGIPSKANAMRTIFAAADLLHASIVVIVDPDVANITPEWVAAIGAPIRDHGFDFVAPVYQRGAAEGLLVTQLLRPLVRATYGWRLHEPVAGEFGCSGRFAAYCAEQPLWHSDAVQNGVNLWVSGTALAGSFKMGQAQLGPRRLVADAPRPPLADLFQQLLTTAFSMIDAHDAYWLPRTQVDDVPVLGTPVEESPPPEPPPAHATRLLASFAQDVENLDEILRRILTPQTLAAVTAAAHTGDGHARLPDALWAATVAEFLVAYHQGVMRRDHITQALLPLYIARTGTFLLEHAGGAPDVLETALESLCVQFERAKAHIIERWTQPAAR